jgi:SAM-dependent methyltransferase
MPSAADPYVHGHHDSVLRSHRWRTAENSAGYLLSRLAADARVLDVGCGPGTITVGLAAWAARGWVVGLDAACDVLADARREGRRRGQANVCFAVGDAYQLAFGEATFDVVHAHQLLQHLSDPVAALTEMRRVCVPGGVVAARDGDYGGMIWFPDDPELGQWRQLYRRVARVLHGEPDAGRRLLAWWGRLWAERLTDSPFGDHAVEHGLATRADLDRLAAAWLRWADSEDGWFLVPHGEILCRVSSSPSKPSSCPLTRLYWLKTGNGR